LSICLPRKRVRAVSFLGALVLVGAACGDVSGGADLAADGSASLDGASGLTTPTQPQVGNVDDLAQSGGVADPAAAPVEILAPAPPTLPGQAPVAAVPADPAAPVAPTPTAPAEPSSVPTEAPAATEAPTTAAPAPQANNFPAGAVTKISDGSSVDLKATLGGGNTPVLFWFWGSF